MKGSRINSNYVLKYYLGGEKIWFEFTTILDKTFQGKNGLHQKPESSLGAEKTLQNVVLCLKGLS